jgi:iron complex transport system ATP-binding protein
LLFDLTRKGKTVIFSTHDLNIASDYSDKVWLLSDENILEGAPEDLFIDKSIAGIFDSPKIHLNPVTGDFELKKEGSGTISLVCDDPVLEHWTRHALQRYGYQVVDSGKNLLKLRVEKDDNKIIWKIQRFDENLIFGSIYELLSNL